MSFKALYMLKFLCITSQLFDFHMSNFHCFLPLLPFSLLHAPHLPPPLWTFIIHPPPVPPLSPYLSHLLWTVFIRPLQHWPFRLIFLILSGLLPFAHRPFLVSFLPCRCSLLSVLCRRTELTESRLS